MTAMRLYFLPLTLLACFILTPPSHATPIEKKLEQHQQKKDTLEREVKKIEGELSDTKNQLVDVGKSIQSNEQELQILEERIANLETEKTTLSQNLEGDRKSLADLILALERIRRVPPEAMLAKPGAPIETAQSALLMGTILPALNKKAAALKSNLENLEKISGELKEKREAALKATKSLTEKRKELSGLVKKRETIFADTHANLKQEKETLRRISNEAKNVTDLVGRLKEERKKSKKTALIPDVINVPPGRARLPVSGKVRIGFDDPDDFGAPSKGISIESRAGALVVAPMGGVVRFAGSFKNYGNMVIVEHENGYHSLIAGLEKIDTVVGQSVSAGEALGFLHGAGDSGENPALYYELRRNGKPVNPATKFSGLG